MILSQHLAAGVCSGKANPVSGSDSSGKSPIFYAVHCGNEKYVHQLIQTPQLLHQVDADGRSVLAIAVGREELKIVQDLIAAGADICSKDSEGITPLHLATKCSPDIMKAVFSKLTVHNVDITDSLGRTALHWASALAKESACRALLQAGANTAKLDQHRRTPLHWLAISENSEQAPSVATLFLKAYPDLVRWQDARGATPFHLAACSGNTSLLTTLLEFVDRDSINRADNLFRTPLHYACALGHAEVTRLLLDAGAKMNAADCESATPVHLAAYWNHADCLSVLIDVGGPSIASALADSAGLSPLHWAVARRNFDAARCLCSATSSPPPSLLLVAAANGDDAMVDLLLSNNVRVSEGLDEKTSSTPLIYAACHGHVTVMMTLIHRGKAKVEQRDLRGRTALHWAAMSGSPQACRFLLESGCPHDAVEYLGCTALHCAAFSSADCVKLLLQYLPVECKDRYGFTALHWACLGRNVASAKLLLFAGAAVNALGKTRDRQTPLDCALRRNATEVAELLVSVGGMTAHGLKESSATKIQSSWRAYRVRRTINVVKRHELGLARVQKPQSKNNATPSPYFDNKIEAVYYGMGKRSEGSDTSDNFFDDDANGSQAKSKPHPSDEVAPPLISISKNNAPVDAAPVEIRKRSNSQVRFASSADSSVGPSQRSDYKSSYQQSSHPESSFEAVEHDTAKSTDHGSEEERGGSMSMAALVSVVTMAKRNRRYSIFGVVVDDGTDEPDDDEDLTPEELQQKYYRMSEEQIILQESTAARKLRVAEMVRVEAVRARERAANIIQRSWRRYKRNKKSTQTQKLTARQMRLRAGEHAWRRQMAAITLQNAWRKHHRNEVLKTLHQQPELQQVQSPLSTMMRSTRQAVLVASIYGGKPSNLTITQLRRPQTSRPDKPTGSPKPTVKPLNDLSKPRPAAISFNFAHRQYTRPVITASSQTFK